MKGQEKKESLFVIICLLSVVIIVIFLFPSINKFIENKKLPNIKPDNSKEEKEVEVLTKDEIENFHRPLMRNGVYNSSTYYNLDKFTISNLSNNDILYNAFLSIDDADVVLDSIGTYGCVSNSKSVGKDIMKLRINNFLGKNVNYTFDKFSIPEGASNDYAGDWIYDSQTSKFIYYGLCSSEKNNIKYYDIEQFIKAEYDKKDAIVYYYVGFAKVEGSNYNIYSDPNMTNEISNGIISNEIDLNKIYEELDDKDKKIYKYTFKNTICSYSEYCLYEGKWVNGI